MKKRSQEFRERYFDIGQFYFASSDAWIKKKKVIFVDKFHKSCL